MISTHKEKSPTINGDFSKAWTAITKNWNTLSSDILEKAEFIEHNSILDCLLKLETSDNKAKEQ